MSSAANAINSVMPILAQSTAAANVSAISDLRQTDAKAGASFENILGKVSETVMNTKTGDTGKDLGQLKQDTKDVSAQPKENASSLEQTKTAADENANGLNEETNVSAEKTDNNIVKETDDGAQGKEASKELQEAIDEDGRMLITEMAKELEMSEDDIVNAMQMLGLTPADLLIPGNIQQVVLVSTSNETALDLITDSDLYTSLQDLIEDADSMGSELMKEFDLTEEDLQEAIGITHEEFSEKIKVDNKKESEAVTVPLTEEPKQDNEVLFKVKAKETVKVSFEEDVDHDFKPIEISHETEQNNSESSLNKQATPENIFNTFIKNVTDTITTDFDVINTEVYEQRAQMENVIRQITEKITITSKEDVTSMELSLHPASLGNVSVHLTSTKDGIVAKFAAQNEIVKEAVESQLVMLQQKFEEKGIKVTSVEVTIASHGFEQNLDEGNQKEAPGEDPKNKKSLRRINLSEIKDIDESLEEEEKLQAQMMAMNGNTVDFSA
ncbi:hypothetical protein D6853_04340 [Butyrivibrio sp. X503]|uniref:flagellar hook-length control protein FliK n=1 Tax=Butyrivibrio sp. X503 TaxID=2364878 RepID=UPI000EAAA69E|nr:flagellar hook-length control protein FliK [Butyrivibrio sp. X503]RKM57249.1 hypothetical protein D6853_04340 [Butyrivibrio sp. X503]